MTAVWVDLRAAEREVRTAIAESALHGRVEAIICSDVAVLADLPPTVRRGYGATDLESWHRGGVTLDGPEGADFAVMPIETSADLDRVVDGRAAFVPDVHVTDQASLDLACAAAVLCDATIVRFADPTKIPLEIVLAAAGRSANVLVCAVGDAEEARIVGGVLERGAEAVMITPREPREVLTVLQAVAPASPTIVLTTLQVEAIEHVGLGDRVCVDTCSHFMEDEGILVGSFAHGFVLCCSETHPLPYMPTRPFRVNAGALHSYVLGRDNRTNYLSELRSGMTVRAVNADGQTRELVVGRVKLERRPLLLITARAAGGESVCLTLQDDWHVRVLGPGGTVLNVTELVKGTEVLGHVAVDRRHVGYAVDEFCIET